MIHDTTGKPFDHTAMFSTVFLESRYPEPDVLTKNTNMVYVRDNGVYIFPGSPATLFPGWDYGELDLPVQHVQYLGHRGTAVYYAAEMPSGTAVSVGTFYPNIRELYSVLSDDELAIASLAVRIVDFNRTTRFCGQCGAKTRPSRQERAKVCDACGLVTYPRTSPAIIVLVRKNDEILLARSPRFPPDLHSILAGFVDPAETLDEAVHREVREETGIEIANIRYLGSEPWPFPNSLMIGFVADYAGGEIAIDNNEIISAGWFDRDHLPDLPSRMSISRALIDWWIAEGTDRRA
jgi:NAD+ diphosphatase